MEPKRILVVVREPAPATGPSRGLPKPHVGGVDFGDGFCIWAREGASPGGRRAFRRCYDWEALESGLWYSPELGEFLSQDPLGYHDSFNLYAYTAFDPINGWDPFGLCDPVTASACVSPGGAIPGVNYTPGVPYTPGPGMRTPVPLQGYSATPIKSAPTARPSPSPRAGVRPGSGPGMGLAYGFLFGLLSDEPPPGFFEPEPPEPPDPLRFPPPGPSGAEGGPGHDEPPGLSGPPAQAGGDKPKTPVPELDPSGTVHTPPGEDLPTHVPPDWTREDLEQIRDDLEQSIKRRKETQRQKGEKGPKGPGHRNRIREEERLKRQIEKKLNLQPRGTEPDIPKKPSPPAGGPQLGTRALPNPLAPLSGGSPQPSRGECRKSMACAGTR
ncbi:MAG: hypothetical protein HYZ28_17645 [Myxococcales bacterium]|nr:hypothetical protein [Myxococcales bacterium]